MSSKSALAAAALTLASLAAPGLAGAQLPPDLSLQPVVTSGLSQPLALRHAGDGSNRLFVVEQGGRIMIVADGALLPAPFLTISSATPGGFVSSGESGLLGLAFHPQYAANGRLYINYTDGAGDTRIVEYTVSAGNPDLVDTGSRRELMRIAQPAWNHNGGNLLFGPDGYLYIGMGDGGGSGGAGQGLSQDPASLLGKMLRIDVDVTSASHPHACGNAGTQTYGIPADNPFAGGGGCAETVYVGLRNPWRWSFDRASGDLFIADVGQNSREEVNFVAAAALNQLHNFGWKCFEGTAPYSSCPGGMAWPHTPPILEYSQSGTSHCSITGGYRYRGPVTGLQGVYVYGDYCSRQIWFATEDGGHWTASTWGAPAPGNIRSFGEDEQGNLYVLRAGGVAVSMFHSSQTGPVFFTVTPVAGSGGQLDPDTPQQVEEGDTVVFQVLPDPGYLIDTVSGCGGSLDGNSYSTAPVLEDCQVSASFTADPDLIFRNGFESGG